MGNESKQITTAPAIPGEKKKASENNDTIRYMRWEKRKIPDVISLLGLIKPAAQEQEIILNHGCHLKWQGLKQVEHGLVFG